MPVKQISPYLYFNGRAGDAIELYRRALGAELESLLYFGDKPELSLKPEFKAQEGKRIAHAALRIDGHLIMLSDGMPNQPTGTDSNVHVALDFDDASDLTTRFNALATTGKVNLPIHETFWGGKLGIVIDAFGIHWAFSC